MKNQLNEVKRMQQLAGILTESQLNEEIKSYGDLKQAIEAEFGDIIEDYYFNSGDNFLSISYDAADYYDKSPEFFARKIKNIIKSNPELKSKYKELRPIEKGDWFEDEDYVKYPFLDPDKNDNAPSPDEDLIFLTKN